VVKFVYQISFKPCMDESSSTDYWSRWRQKIQN